jgi:Rrf2 family protein
MIKDRLIYCRDAACCRVDAASEERPGMLLPQTVEYALRAMAYLATQPEGTAVRARDLAAHTGVPAHYLSKILRRLVITGLLTSQKGHGGGFQLAYPAGEITVGEVLSGADYSPNENRCAFGWGQCDPERPCPLHPVWSRLNGAFAAWSEETTLDDVGEWVPFRADGGRRRSRTRRKGTRS